MVWLPFQQLHSLLFCFLGFLRLDKKCNVIPNVSPMDLLIDWFTVKTHLITTKTTSVGRLLFFIPNAWFSHLFYITRPGLLLSLDSKRPSWNRSCMSAFKLLSSINHWYFCVCFFLLIKQLFFFFQHSIRTLIHLHLSLLNGNKTFLGNQ